MLDTELKPILGLGDEWPDDVCVLECSGGKYACMAVGGVFALVCFSSASFAESVALEFPEWPKAHVKELTFDEARDLAKARGQQALALYDDPNNPKIHYVA